MTTAPTADEIRDLDYSRFVGFVRERNRPSGGIRTVQEATMHARVGPASTVLEIGSNTGFTSVNIALLTGARVVGVDVNAASVREATAYAERMGVAELVEFRLGDGTSLDLPEAHFDAVWVSNVTSFVEDKSRLRDELLRVLAPGGTLIAVPIYYRREAPAELVAEVGRAIGTEITVNHLDQWRAFFERGTRGVALTLYHESTFAYDLRSKEAVASYCDELMAKPHLRELEPAVRDLVRDRMEYFMSLFNENLSYCGFAIQLYQKRREPDELELYTSHPALEEVATP